MKGKKIPTSVVKCQCSRCEQIAYVEPNKPHIYCKGIKLSFIAIFPLAFRDLTNPSKKGTWKVYQEPEAVVQDTVPQLDIQESA